MSKTKVFKPLYFASTQSLKKQNFVKLRLKKSKSGAFSHPVQIKDLQNTSAQQKKTPFSSNNILQIIKKIEKTIYKKQLILSGNNIVCAISGGQDSSFLAFCLSFLQSQIAFNCKIIWCNHFWQSCSFYTTLHLTKCARSFSFPIVCFLPLQISASPAFYKTVITKYKKKQEHNKSFCKAKLCNCNQSKALNVRTRSQLYGFYTRFLVIRALQQNVSYCSQKKPKRLQNKANLLIRCLFIKAFQKISRSDQLQNSCMFCFVNKNKVGAAALFSKAAQQPYFHYVKAKCKSEDLNGNGLPLVWPLLVYKGGDKPKGYKKFIETTSETRARAWRHTTIERGCTFYESKTCVHGHTGSDRVETILFNLIRGSGNKGTACLPWKQRHSHFCYNKFYPSYKNLIKNTHLRDC